jgi:hypothetical protein
LVERGLNGEQKVRDANEGNSAVVFAGDGLQARRRSTDTKLAAGIRALPTLEE